MNTPTVPPQSGIDTAAFAETVAHSDTSYKFFWLLALLEIMRRRDYDASATIPFNDMFFVMLKLAKSPLLRFKLSFGVRDKLHQHIAAMEQRAANEKIWNWNTANPILDNSAYRRACADLSAYVPYRWLRPFVQNETRGAGGSTRNQKNINLAIITAANEKFNGDSPPPYRFAEERTGKGIVAHPSWARYFARNGNIIEGWCLWHFAKFLQTRNPNIPAIINKITEDGDSNRRLIKQRQFWAEVMTKESFYCIYSGAKLSRDNFALDHYVPWSFVGHDNMWNLVPAPPSVNSGKGDNLPDKQYLGALAETHHRMLKVRAAHFPKKGGDLMESYAADLKLSFDNFTDGDKLRRAYEMFIPPLIDLARANRFRGGWVYNNKLFSQ